MVAEDFRIFCRLRAFCSIRFSHMGLVGFLDFRETGSDAVDQVPDTRRSSLLNAASVQVVAE